jgi:hypothetical protein
MAALVAARAAREREVGGAATDAMGIRAAAGEAERAREDSGAREEGRWRPGHSSAVDG